MKDFRKWMANTAFDAAAAPMFIVIFGVPILLILAVAGLIFLAVKAVMKISREKKQEDREQ